MTDCYNCLNYSDSFDRCRVGRCNYPEDARTDAMLYQIQKEVSESEKRHEMYRKGDNKSD